MRISELSRSSGVAVATIKYYLREGLLHEGERTSATQARYDDSHLARLGLVRALLGVGGLSIAATKNVLAELDHPPESMHELLGSVTHQLVPEIKEELDLAEARTLVDELGWWFEPDHDDQLRPLAAALAGMRAAGFELSDLELINYGRAMHEIAADEVARVPTDSQEAAVRYVTLGIVLVEPLLLALRRLAQVDVSARRFEKGQATSG
ncbi:MerR family transcriptional regulator [Microlunatus speluncae]|uniref:MerR family transcriptional regulator n=1 Tax=Microlunatus speluncae TaxID=2594267 RepID=UPI0012662EF6|nr:MerR family transcriptional regulator [Microlunatus speluncae]